MYSTLKDAVLAFGDQVGAEKMGLALSKMIQEDPSFHMETDQESGETISPDNLVANILEKSSGSFQMRLKDGTTKKLMISLNVCPILTIIL